MGPRFLVDKELERSEGDSFLDDAEISHLEEQTRLIHKVTVDVDLLVRDLLGLHDFQNWG